MRTGIAWYVGVPNSGKSTLARAHAIRAAKENRWPLLVIDTERVANFRELDHARSVASVVERLWKRRVSVAFTPNTTEEALAVFEAVHKAGRVNMVIDEAPAWFDARRGGRIREVILRLMRSHRHSKVRLFLTAHHLTGDVPDAAISCSPELFVFRCTSARSLDRLEAHFGLDRERVRSLGQYVFLRVFEGFEPR